MHALFSVLKGWGSHISLSTMRGLLLFGTGIIVGLTGGLTGGNRLVWPVSAATHIADTAQQAEPPAVTASTAWAWGESAQGRHLLTYRWGQGDAKIAFVGGIHGGYEQNTIDLSQRAITFFDEHPALIPDNVSLYIIPSLNPDGQASGSRFNANSVDLNRNWDCGWQPAAYHRSNRVNPGRSAFSEPESVALANFVLAEGIDALIFYHSAGKFISTGGCATATALTHSLGDIVSQITGYAFYPNSTSYPVTGDATGYFNQMGLAAIEIELPTHESVDWQHSRNGMIAAINWASQALAPTEIIVLPPEVPAEVAGASLDEMSGEVSDEASSQVSAEAAIVPCVVEKE